jgi:hypothetical protein
MQSIRNQLVFASLILQRNPIKMKELTEFERSYFAYSEAVRSEKSKGLFEFDANSGDESGRNPDVFGLSKASAFTYDETLTESTGSSYHAISRLPDRKLYLIVNSESVWKFPNWPVNIEDNTSSLRSRVQLETQNIFKSNPDIYFVGNAPIAHHLERFSDRVLPPFSALHFFFKAQFILGHLDIPLEYAWATAEEMKAKVTKGYWGAVKDVLSY